MSGVLDANAGVGASAAVEGRKQSARCSIGRPEKTVYRMRRCQLVYKYREIRITALNGED